jgi:acyl-coenzyme A synthetase/AMP-(fatty) acid ligase
MAKACAALIELDGLARRIVLCPPGVDDASLPKLARDAEVDVVVHDGDAAPPDCGVEEFVACRLPLTPIARAVRAPRATEWALLTSGTSGGPKIVVHDLRGLTDAIAPAPAQVWGTFYDIRRYGGLQIFLRALCGRGSLTLSGPGEPTEAFLKRLGRAGATHISGTPSHWRKALMSGAPKFIDPQGVRLSGEIADQPILDALRAAFPKAEIGHAYASTEAGVAFAVADGLAGFPAALVDGEGPVAIRLIDNCLSIRSRGAAFRYLGDNAPALRDAEGFVDSGDQVELRGDRYYFLGRRGGIINVGGSKVHPEEVEAIINAEPGVRSSRVFARKNPITGAIVAAEVVLSEPTRASDALARQILAACRAKLEAYKAPSSIRFVADLAVTDGGKLARHG